MILGKSPPIFLRETTKMLENEYVWPKSFGSYKPRSQRVYGAICKNNSDKFLLIQGRKTGRWSWPKGHIHYGEKVYDCVMREVWEETGISNLPLPDTSLKLKSGEYFLYKFKDETPALHPNDISEVMDIGWFSIDEIRNNSRNCNIDVNLFARREKFSQYFKDN